MGAGMLDGMGLLSALSSDDATRAQWILDRHPASAAAVDESGRGSALMAASIGAHGLLERLLQAGADPHQADRLGQTALHLAAATESLECVRILADERSAAARNKLGATPFMSACVRGDASIASHLSRDGQLAQPRIDGFTPLMAAAKRWALDCMAIAMPGNDPNAVDDGFWNALMHACASGHAEAVRVLFPTTDLDAMDDEGWSALEIAKDSGRVDICPDLRQAMAARGSLLIDQAPPALPYRA